MLVALMAKQHFLIKSEPYKYSFSDLVRDGHTTWDGIRSFEARNNLRSMKKGDLCLFYHSNEGKAVVGVARVARTAFQDPSTEDDWSAVELEPVKALARAIDLDEMRGHRVLGRMMIFRRQRLSVVPVTKDEFDVVVELGKSAPAKSALSPRK
jgi:predicted RNA-binding protein with PUA-like domain